MTEQTPESPQPEQPERPDAVESISLAAETLGKDLLEAMVGELQAVPEWDRVSQVTQEQAIGRLRARTRVLIAQTLQILFRGQYPATPATLVGVTFGKSIKATLDISRTAHGRHELTDALGQQVLVVLANPDDYTERMDEIKARDKQGDLFPSSDSGVTQTESYTGGDPRPFRRDEPGLGDTEQSEAPYTGDIDPPDPGDLSLEPDPIWQQARDALAKVNVRVSDADAQSWTADQCAAAMYWSQRMQADADTAPAMPKFISPEPNHDDIH